MLSVALNFNLGLGLLRQAPNKLLLVELEFVSNLVERKKLLCHFTSECLMYGTNLNVSILFKISLFVSLATSATEAA